MTDRTAEELADELNRRYFSPDDCREVVCPAILMLRAQVLQLRDKDKRIAELEAFLSGVTSTEPVEDRPFDLGGD